MTDAPEAVAAYPFGSGSCFSMVEEVFVSEAPVFSNPSLESVFMFCKLFDDSLMVMVPLVWALLFT